jgi:hypothetical protein
MRNRQTARMSAGGRAPSIAGKTRQQPSNVFVNKTPQLIQALQRRGTCSFAPIKPAEDPDGPPPPPPAEVQVVATRSAEELKAENEKAVRASGNFYDFSQDAGHKHNPLFID